MLIIPAIDIQEGHCVRLRQGKFDKSTIYGTDPLAMAEYWISQGARRLHLVDLDGALHGKPINFKAIQKITKTLSQLPIQIGGGIRSLNHIEAYLNQGVEYVIIGTQAVRDAAFVQKACQEFPGQVMIGIDARATQIAISGWAEQSAISVFDLASRLPDWGVDTIIYTDIERDGMLEGVNVNATAELADYSQLNVIASGGITDLKDIENLSQASSRITGAIIGRALYEARIDLQQAQQFCDEGLSAAVLGNV